MFYPMSHVPHFGRMVPDFVVPICLPFLDPAEEDYMNVTSKTLTDVAGWGATTERGMNVQRYRCKKGYRAWLKGGPQVW